MDDREDRTADRRGESSEVRASLADSVRGHDIVPISGQGAGGGGGGGRRVDETSGCGDDDTGSGYDAKTVRFESALLFRAENDTREIVAVQLYNIDP